MTDTHTQPATCDTLTTYGEGMHADAPPTPSPAARAALTECDTIDRLLEELEHARTRRDEAIVRMHTEDGMNSPSIERALGKRVSKSNVRTIGYKRGLKI